MVLPKTRRVLRLPAVIAKTGLQNDTIYVGMREGWFPKNFKLTPDRPDTKAYNRAVGWFEDEIDAYLERQAATRSTSTDSRP